MTENNSGFHRAVSAEMAKQDRKGFNVEHDNQVGIDYLLSIAYDYIADGYTVKGAAMVIAARRWLVNNSSKNPMQVAVEEFMRRCDQEVRSYPGIPDEDVKVLRIRLMVEELLGSNMPTKEHNYGETYAHLLIQNKSDELVQSMMDDDIVGIADGLADVLYVVIGTAIAYGINIQEVFDEVHRSNLSKTVWNEDLQRWYIEKDEFGKGIKSESYSPADLEPIVHSQIQYGMLAEAEADPSLEVIEIEVPDNA